jgi:hypothetical protein
MPNSTPYRIRIAAGWIARPGRRSDTAVRSVLALSTEGSEAPITMPTDTKAAKLRHYLAQDHTYTRYPDLGHVPRGWTFVEHPEGGIVAW